MKRITRHIPVLAIALAAIVALSSCVRNEYYQPQPQPQQPIGYQYYFEDNFDNNQYNWAFSDPQNSAYVDIYNGELVYDYNPPNEGSNTVAISTGVDMRYDFLIQTRMSSNYAMGLAFAVSPNDYGYSFFIDESGYFAVYREGSAGEQPTVILDWQYSAAINNNNNWNDVELEQIGNYWTGYINGTEVFRIQAQATYGNQVGYIVLAGTLGYADYLAIQY